MREAKFYRKIDGGKVECRACHHLCRLSDGGYGRCGVRQNTAGKLYSIVYGRAAALNIDPIEKKPLYHFLPETKILSLGTEGCNFSCQFCQNFDLSQSIKTDHNLHSGKPVSPSDLVKMALKLNLPSIAYTYNEPTVFVEYALDTMKLARRAGLKNVWVSNGYFSSEDLEAISPYLDAINVDLKAYSDDFYRKICGARLQPVLNNIEAIAKSKIHLEVTTLLINGLNDDEKELTKLARFLADLDVNIPWHLSRFFPCYKLINSPVTSIKSLEKAKDVGRAAGLKNIYIGNI